MRIPWRTISVAGFFAAALFLPGLSLETVPPPAETGYLLLEAPTRTDVWMSPPLEIEATAAGLSWIDGGAPEHAWVRSSPDGSNWGPWVELQSDPDHGPDPGTLEEGSERDATDPVWVGEARFLQYRVEGSSVDLHAEYVETAGRNLSAWEKVKLFFRRVSFGAGAAAQPDQPAMVSRAEWGGDACVGDREPERHYADRVELVFLHHSVHGGNANGYAADEAKDLVYAICSYHVNVRGWSDIGYNFIVDKYGTVYEGRGGGVDTGVIAAHTGGFNSYSSGITFLGDHTSVAPTDAAQTALRRLAAWKLDVHHVDPLSVVTLESLGSTKYPEGTIVQLPAVSGHRDASITACPGPACYALLDPFRAGISEEGGPKIYGGWPDRSFVDGSPQTGYEPVTIPFRFTEPMEWTLAIQDEGGALMMRADGVDESGSVTWDGTVDGEPVPVGRYLVRIDAVPVSGADAPRSSSFSFRVGFNPPFRDDEGSIHEQDIATISEAGITRGCGPELYCPSATVTRWQMALFLTRFHTFGGLALPEGSDQGFSDITDLPPDYQLAINQLSELGVTRGTAPGKFEPFATVTRWQMALFLTRLLEAEGIVLPDGSDQGFLDIVDLPLDYQTAINQLRQMNVTNQEGEYHPDQVMPRDQMASFLARSSSIVLPGVEE